MHLRLIAFVICLMIAVPALAERRVALLIGNGAYLNSPRLANPGNDVALITRTLKDAGFETVLTRTDQTLADMRDTLKAFETAVAGADVALVFYSGHGLEIGGENYLVPVDAKLQSDRDVKFETIALDDVLHAMSGATKLKLVLLDACRDNPFVNAMKRAGAARGGLARGLGRIEQPASSTLIAFAAAPGQVALDGDGVNSPFSEAIARNLTVPGVDVRLALGGVHDDVMAATKGQQEPYQTGSLGRDPVFLGPPAGSPAVVVKPQPTPEPLKPVAVRPPEPPKPAAPDPEDNTLPPYFFPDSNTRVLSVRDLQGLSAAELRIARNEIFARKGRIFASADLDQHFRQFVWYRPVAAEVTLNAVEKANVALIQQAENAGGTLAAAPSFVFPDSDRRLLSPAEVARLNGAALRIARNEIYARRGRYFDNQALTAYFSRFPWYRPNTWDPPLNEIERRNVDLLAAAEKAR